MKLARLVWARAKVSEVEILKLGQQQQQQMKG
jgi:hypothetical protein